MTAERLNVAIRTSNQVGFLLKSGSQWLNATTLALEDYSAGNYVIGKYLILGARVGTSINVDAAVPAGSPAARYDVTPVEAVGTDGSGAGGFAPDIDQSAGGMYTIQWNGTAITDDLGTDVDPLKALITLAEAKQFLNESGTDSDAVLAMLINDISGLIADHVGKDLISKVRTEYYDGDGSDTLILLHRPVTSVSAIYIDNNRVFGSDTLVAASDYIVKKETGFIKAWYLFGSWYCGNANIKVVNTAGYTVGPSGTMPGPIKYAVKRTLKRHYVDGFTHGKLDRSSDVIGDANTTYRSPGLADDVLADLAPYRSFLGCPQFSHAD